MTHVVTYKIVRLTFLIVRQIIWELLMGFWFKKTSAIAEGPWSGRSGENTGGGLSYILGGGGGLLQ